MGIKLIFPHQLFEDSPLLGLKGTIYLIEEYLFFTQYGFHKQKIAFHRASMKFYAHYLLQSGHEVVYIEANDPKADIRWFLEQAEAKKVSVIDPTDNYLHKRLKAGCKKKGIALEILESPGFLNATTDLSNYFKPTKKKFFQTEFYKKERNRLNILIDESGHPEGGKWTFDQENRKKYSAKKIPPPVNFPEQDQFFSESKTYTEKYFAGNHGKLPDSPHYPTTFEASKRWLKQFLETRFSEFGDYEDALVSTERILNHSVLSPLINAGLLTPSYVINEILIYAKRKKIGINNTEGIVRQIIGWREFIRGVYEVKGSEERTENYWEFTREMPSSFYTGTTGIAPVDNAIEKVLATGYNHHIERLMVIGNFMLLCEIKPNDVYKWFMEMYIDAYDWVMVPNVYGMSQFADGGLMSTKPYISSSNYLMKMSDFKKGSWQKVWDGLFWRFMHVHRTFFEKNPRLGMLIRTFDKMSADKKSEHLEAADHFLNFLDHGSVKRVKGDGVG